MNGIINVYKEKGFTSFDVCAKLRGILKTKKIGHTGTLDPEAQGVLPVCIGNATKLCDLLTDKDKTYETVLRLGVTTDTQDMTGDVLDIKEVNVKIPQVKQVIESFIGEIEQIPPMYSALKVDGKKLYELARQGITVTRKSRPITIHAIEILDYVCNEKDMVQEVSMRVTCSKGTYIRTLCHDIGEMLGCGGCMKELLRTKVSMFELEQSLTLRQIEEKVQLGQIQEILIAVDSIFPSLLKMTTKNEYDKYLANGNKLSVDYFTCKTPELTNLTQIRVYNSENIFCGIYEYIEKEQLYKPVKMFLH